MPTPNSPRDAFKLAYKIFSWVTLASLVITILLVLHKAPPPAATYDPAAPARVEQKFEAADQAHAQGQPAQVQLDSTELNSYLAQNLQLEGSSQATLPSQVVQAAQSLAAPASGSPQASPVTPESLANQPGEQPSLEEVQSSVKDVKVDMDGDLVKAYVVFDLHGKDMSLELDGHLASENGYMKFEPVAGKIGSFPLPQSALNAAVSRLMNSPENREKLKLPEGVSDIAIQNGQAVVSYK